MAKLTHEDFLKRQTEARARLIAMEVAIQAATNEQPQQDRDARATAVVAAEASGGAGAVGASGSVQAGVGTTAEPPPNWATTALRWLYNQMPGHEYVEAAARAAWAEAVREVTAVGNAYNDLTRRLEDIKNDPAKYAKKAWQEGARFGGYMDQARNKPHCEERDGTPLFDGPIWASALQIKETIYYKTTPDKIAAGTLATKVPPAGAHLSDPEHSFLYLDVGRWGGAKGANCQRDFGIVAFNVAVLCEFGSGIRSAGLGPTIPEGHPGLDPQVAREINLLLTKIGEFGKVMVVRALSANYGDASNGDAEDAYMKIIFGDHVGPLKDLPWLARREAAAVQQHVLCVVHAV